MTVYGRCKVNITLGQVSLHDEVVIAEINDEVLLGMDILKGKDGKPADIILSQNKIILNGHEINCQHYPQICDRKVRAAEDYKIQGHTEQIIDAFVERCESDDSLFSSDFIVEPSRNFKENFPLVMAPCLIDINYAPTVKVRVMNPFPTEASIKADTIIGYAEILTCTPESFQACENEQEKGNSSSVRGLQFSDVHDDQLGRINTVKSKNFSHTDATSNNDQFSPAQSENQECNIPQHLQQLFDRSSEGRSQKETLEIKKLLSEYQDIFSKHDDDLGLTSLAEHRIDLTDSKPIKQPFRRVPLAFVNEEKQAIDKLLKQGVIRPSSSPWASPLCLVRKKDGSVRPCVDYRRLNKVTKPDAFPVPKVDECIDAISGSKIFSTVDLTCGYFQVPVRSQDIPKTAFVSRHGLYEFTSTPFGMINSGATFQRVMELAMKGLNWQICIIYIDDCIIFSSTFDEHIERLRLVFQRFRQANLKLKAKKCELLRNTVTFLGFKVTENGACPDPNNVAKVLQWPVPANVTEVKQFLGLCSYYRKHVKQFSIIAKPLFDLTKKDSKLVWNNECQCAFDTLKKALTSNQVMALPTANAEGLIIDVDA